MAALLGKRTGEMHIALASEQTDPKFTPEPFSLLYQRSLFHSMRILTRRVFDLMRKNLKKTGPEIRPEIEGLLAKEKEIVKGFAKLSSSKLASTKIRIHGDYHLGQVLYTGNDFVIIDFEGEPARPIGERRLKRSPLRDVAGMIRSFHYPTYSILYSRKMYSEQEIHDLRPWAEAWYKSVVATYLKSYLSTVKAKSFVPAERGEFDLMLKAYLMEKAIYEVGYELNNRPDWVTIPLHGIKDLMEN